MCTQGQDKLSILAYIMYLKGNFGKVIFSPVQLKRKGDTAAATNDNSVSFIKIKGAIPEQELEKDKIY